MPTSRTTFAKRQKEKARQEKRAEKQARRTQRREQGSPDDAAQVTQPTADLTIVHDEDGVPMGFDFHDFAK
jgi:hypothetical protein